MLAVKTQLRESLPGALDSSLATNRTITTQGALLHALLPILKEGPEHAVQAGQLIESFLDIVSAVPPDLFSGYSVILEKALSELQSEVHGIQKQGRDVDILEHIEITRRLAEKAQSYLTVNWKAFSVPDEWTAEWRKLVTELGSRNDLARSYIVLLDDSLIGVEDYKLRSMEDFLSRHGWIFKVCSVGSVIEALAGQLPTERNIEVFDHKIVKYQTVPEGLYRGGIRLNLSFEVLVNNGAMDRFLNLVLTHARELGENH